MMAPQPGLRFGRAETAAPTIFVDQNQTYQSIEGFGASFTDSAAWLLEKVAPKAERNAALHDLFTRKGNGIGLSFMRHPIGATDIALSVYSFDDLAAGQSDPLLKKFSIAHDEDYILPLLRQARTLNPQMKIMASPWSPPGWMKDPSSMPSVSMLGGKMQLTPAVETAFANYFVRYIQAYHAAGIPIDYISLQNEPLNVTTGYPSMDMQAPVQLQLLRGYVLPALRKAGLNTKVLVYDHNWDQYNYPQTVLAGLLPEQQSQIAGIAWHAYGGVAGSQQLLANQYPALGQYMTEYSGGTWIKNQFESDFLGITHVLRNAGKAYVKWSLALNEKRGPDLTQNAKLGGCDTCTPIVTVNSQSGAITKTIEYYTLGHFSKYILPGARRIYSSNTGGIVSTAFANPNGEKVLVAYNHSASTQSFKVQWGSASFAYTLPASAATTFVWRGQQQSSTVLDARQQIQASSYSTENGMQSEPTNDASGAYDLGFITPGAYAVYKHVDFGKGITAVDLRSASKGSGGVLTLRLDSVDGQVIATTQLPVTGGWQNWETTSAAVHNASGIHDLYLVFPASNSAYISNLNWFQFR